MFVYLLTIPGSYEAGRTIGIFDNIDTATECAEKETGRRMTFKLLVNVDNCYACWKSAGYRIYQLRLNDPVESLYI